MSWVQIVTISAMKFKFWMAGAFQKDMSLVL